MSQHPSVFRLVLALPDMKGAVAVIAAARPHYFSRTMAHLKATRANWPMVCHIEPTPRADELVEIAAAYGMVQIVLNPEVYGCNRNTFGAIHHAFSVAPYVVFVEEDVLVAPDFFDYHAWAAERYRDDQQVLSVSPHNRSDGREQPYDVFRRNFFTSWGFGTWKDRFELMVEWWPEEQSWDVCMLANKGPRCEIAPKLGRVQNIGREGGIHRLSYEFYEQRVHNPYFEYACTLPRGSFEEVAA